MVELLFLALALAMDAFAVSIVRGAAGKHQFVRALETGLAFGIAQGVMPFLGWALGALFLQWIEAFDHWIAFGLLGFLGANFGSIAMQPFAKIAGAASSVQTFFRMFGAALVGMVIGQAFDGTAKPFALSLLISSTLALLFVLYSEKGVLFRRLNVKPPKERIVP